jgi:hypothetical protein
MRGLAACAVRAIAFLLTCGTAAATAQTHEASAPPAASDELSGGSKPEHFLFFGGFDIWHFGYAGYAGAQWAPKALNNDGFVLSVFMSDGVERYDSATARYRTTIFRAAILPGWRFKRGNLEVKVFAGADFERDDFSPVAFPARSYANHFGHARPPICGGSQLQRRCCRHPYQSPASRLVTPLGLLPDGATSVPSGSAPKSRCRPIASASNTASARISPD